MTSIIKNLTTLEFERDSKGNLYFFNNLKFWLILVIVLAGFTFPIEHINWFYKGMGMIVVSIPMPIFNFVAGYFAKSIIDKKTGKFQFQRVFQTLVLYLFMSLSAFVIDYFLLHTTTSYKFFQPVNPEWYLLACAVWYASIPLVSNIKPSYVMIGSVALALIVGMDPMVGDFMALSRIICYFPFFIGAYYLSEDTLLKILNFGGNFIRAISFLLLVGFLIFCLWDPLNFVQWKQLITTNYPYEKIAALGHMYNLTGCLARLLWFVGISLIILTFMYIIPRTKTSYSNIGSKTLQIFILHSIAVKLLTFLGLYKFVELYDLWFVVLMHIIISIALTLLFSLKPFQAPYNMVMRWQFGSTYL